MLNCDQTFDCLTDPIHRHSADVEQHLASCPRCRDMAEILEPALDLFDESIDGESWDLPMQSSEYGLDPQPHTDRAPAAASRPWASRPNRRTRVRDEGLTVAVFLVLAATLAAALVNVGSNDGSNAVAITLPPNCQRTESTEAEADNVIAGCVACHLKMESLAEMDTVQRRHAQSLVQKCATCHLDMAAEPATTVMMADAGDATQGVLSVCLFGHSGG